MPFHLPSVNEKYEVLYKMAEGGMGEVYLARHRLLEEDRVIKVMHPQGGVGGELQARFRREARTAAKVRHPNIAQLYDFATEEDGTSWIVMEYIDGRNLGELLRDSGRPSVPLTLEIARQSLRALQYLHDKGFVHRDVAPDNLMVSRTHEGDPLVKLIDLGIAKAFAPGVSEAAALTMQGGFVGKARYTAPELFRDEGSDALSPACDVYSFGVVFYELLTGVCPIRGKSFTEVLSQHLFQPPVAFEESDPNGLVPQPVRDLAMQMLAKEPAQRFADAAAVQARLEPLCSDPGRHRGEMQILLADEEETGEETVILRRDQVLLEPNAELSEVQPGPKSPESKPRAAAAIAAARPVELPQHEAQPPAPAPAGRWATRTLWPPPVWIWGALVLAAALVLLWVLR